MNHDLPPLTPRQEATMQEEIDLALELYRDIAPPAMLAEMRELLEETLRTHEVPRRLLNAFTPREEVQSSGDVPKDPSQIDDEASGKEGK
jgi:hypothetical protein